MTEDSKQLYPADRRTGDMMILEKLGHIEKELAVNTTETKNIVTRLDKLNGAVAHHEEKIGDHKLNLKEMFGQISGVFVRLHELELYKASQDKLRQDLSADEAKTLRARQWFWIERFALPVSGAILYALLTRSGIINF